MENLIIILAAFLLSMGSCNKSSKIESTVNSDSAKVNVPVVADGVKTIDSSEIKSKVDVKEVENKKDTVSKTSTNNDPYSLVVSFFSKGAGKDREALAKFDELLENNKSRLLIEKYTWGREGEIDYCIRTEKMRPAEQKQFVKNVKIIVENSELVHIQENAGCRHKK